MLIDKATLDQIQRSFGRALQAGPLMENFYRAFLASDAEIREYFANTDMEKQRVLLRQGIGLAIMFAGKSPFGMSALDRLAKSHSHSEMDIAPKWYPLWKSSFISSVAALDPKFSPDLQRAWSTVLQQSINHMTALYER